jgi:hypothetical protein
MTTMESMDRTARLMRIGQNLLVLIPTAIGVVGTFLCVMAPEAAGIRGLAYASLVTYCISTPLAALKLVGVFAEFPSEWFVLTLNSFTGLSWLLFMLFLKGLAKYLHERALFHDANPVIYLGSITWSCLTLGPLMAGTLINIFGCLGVLLAFGLLVALIAYGIRFLMHFVAYLMDMQAAIGRA